MIYRRISKICIQFFFVLTLAFIGGSTLQAVNIDAKSLRRNHVYLVHASDFIYEGGDVIPGFTQLLQEQGITAIHPGASPLMRLTIQNYRSDTPTRYAYVDTLANMGSMVATEGTEAYYLGRHTFRWLVAPIEDRDDLANFGFQEDQIIFYRPSRGETIQSAVRNFLRRSGGLSQLPGESWGNFLRGLSQFLGQPTVTFRGEFNFNRDRFLQAQRFEEDLRLVHEPITTALVQRRTDNPLVFYSPPMNRHAIDERLARIDRFHHYLRLFAANSVLMTNWLTSWRACTAFWRSRLELYQYYLMSYSMMRARELFAHFIRESAIVLIEEVGELQETHGLTDLQDLIFRRTNPNAGAEGWGTIMDRPFHLEIPHYPDEDVQDNSNEETLIVPALQAQFMPRLIYSSLLHVGIPS